MTSLSKLMLSLIIAIISRAKKQATYLPRPYCLVIGIKQFLPLFSVYPQHCYHCSIVLLHRIPCQSGSFGESRELCDLRVEAHIIPQLALFLGQLFWRGEARKLLLEIFAFLVHLRNQHLMAIAMGTQKSAEHYKRFIKETFPQSESL